jgi:hypothetical protein
MDEIIIKWLKNNIWDFEFKLVKSITIWYFTNYVI